MSLALGQPQGCSGASLGCARARDIFGSLRPSPEKTTCSFPYRFSGKSRNSGLVPGNRDPNPNHVFQHDSVWPRCHHPKLPMFWISGKSLCFLGRKQTQDQQTSWGGKFGEKGTNSTREIQQTQKSFLGCLGSCLNPHVLKPPHSGQNKINFLYVMLTIKWY